MNDRFTYRIQGIRGSKPAAPINKRVICSANNVLESEARQMPRVYMRGDYYVVPPNGARIRTYMPVFLRVMRRGAPEAKQRAFNLMILHNSCEMLFISGFSFILFKIEPISLICEIDCLHHTILISLAKDFYISIDSPMHGSHCKILPTALAPFDLNLPHI